MTHIIPETVPVGYGFRLADKRRVIFKSITAYGADPGLVAQHILRLEDHDTKIKWVADSKQNFT